MAKRPGFLHPDSSPHILDEVVQRQVEENQEKTAKQEVTRDMRDQTTELLNS